MEGTIAGQILQLRFLKIQKILKADIYCHQNHSGMNRNMIKSGTVLDLLILLKESLLKNSEVVYLK